MKKKIFIAINLPEKIKSELVSYQEKIDRFFDDISLSNGLKKIIYTSQCFLLALLNMMS